MSELLSAEEIERQIGDDRCRIFVYPTLNSTNETARALAEEGAEAGTVILAEGQTAGRGRMGRQFFSPVGSGIYMTLLLRPTIAPERALSITTFAAVATARAIERVAGISVSVKWVNDLWIGKKKVCGILAEAALDPSGTRFRYVALGIGINVKKSAFPDELQTIATSIEGECDRTIDRNRLVACILEELAPLFGDDLPENYMDEYRARNLILGKRITVISGTRSFTATATRIEDDGNLIVTHENGREECIAAGEVSLRL